MHHIDPTVERHVTITPMQREAIELYDLHVTFEFGHICITTAQIAARIVHAKGKARQALVGANDPEAGRVHDDAQHFDELLDSMVEQGSLTQPAPAPVRVLPAAQPEPAPKVTREQHAKTAKKDETATPAAAVSDTPKTGGVIAAMVALLSDGNKRTRAQLYDALALQFPDRATAEGGMRVTVGVQLNKLKGKHNIQCNAEKQYWI